MGLINFFSKKYKDSAIELVMDKLKDKKIEHDIEKDIKLAKEKNKLEKEKIYHHYRTEHYLEKYERYPPNSKEANEFMQKAKYHGELLIQLYHQIEDLNRKIRYINQEEEKQSEKIINMVSELKKKYKFAA